MADTVKRLGLGCMRLPLLDPENPRSIDHEQLCQMVDSFLEKGFTYFDTAYMYHKFHSEIFMREALVKRHDRSDYTLTDKLPLYFLKKDGDCQRIFNEQLEKCGVDYFDYYWLHNIKSDSYEIAKKFDCFNFVKEKKAEGKVKHIGFSFHGSPELLDQVLTLYPEMEYVQLQLNYIDWDSPTIQSRRCYEVARKHGKEIIVMEPIKGGTLAKLPPEAEDILKKVRPDMSIASWAIRFVASHEGIKMVLSGMSDMDQLNDNTCYMANFEPLSKEEFAAIDQVVEILNNITAIPCTACRYCVDGCPMNIPIPEYFNLYNADQISLNKGFSIHGAYYENLIETYGKASDCIKCGQCESACPQHLPIREYLVKVSESFED